MYCQGHVLADLLGQQRLDDLGVGGDALYRLLLLLLLLLPLLHLGQQCMLDGGVRTGAGGGRLGRRGAGGCGSRQRGAGGWGGHWWAGDGRLDDGTGRLLCASI